MARYQAHGIERYHLAALILLDESSGRFILDRKNAIQKQFNIKIEPFLLSDDYDPFPSCREPRWETRFRLALKHMRDDGRVKYYGSGQYEITDAGRQYLKSTPLPIELLTEEIELLDNGDLIIRYLSPDGTVMYEVGGGITLDDDKEIL